MGPRTASSRISRRQLLAGGAGVAGLAAVGGCGAEPSVSAANTLQVWGGVPATSGPGDVVAAFNEAHPGFTVTYTRFVNDPRGNLKLDTALQGGVDIDVYFTYAMNTMALRAGSGMALDVTDRVQAEPALAAYLDESTPKVSLTDGRITALATTKEPNLVLFNESLRADAGVTLPRAWTMDEYAETAAALTRPGTYGVYTVPDLARVALGPNYWYSASGGSNFTDPHFEAQLAFGQTMIRSGTAYPWTEVLARQLSAYQQNSFLKQEFAVWPTAPYNLRYLSDDTNYPHDFTVAAAPVPTVPGGQDWNTGQYSNFIMINSKTAKADLAWEFVKFWITEGAGPMLKGGKIPALDLVGQDAVLAGLLGKTPEKHFDVDSFRRVLFSDRPRLLVDTDLTAFPEISLASQQQRDLCWIDEKSPADAVRDLHRQADAAIRRDRTGA